MPESLDVKYFQNRSHLLQHYARRQRAGDVWYNCDARALPEGSQVIPIRGNEEVAQLPDNYSSQLFRMYGRFVWTKLEHKHVNPSGGDNQLPRLFQFASKVFFDSRAYPDYHTSILARTTGWSSGARRPDNSSKARLKVGDVIELIHVQGEETECLAVRT